MRHRLSERDVRLRLGLASFLVALLGGVQAWGWSEDAKNAATEVAGGNASAEAERISFEHNQAVNRMGSRGTQQGGLSHEAYVANQRAFTQRNNGFIRDSAAECGLDVEIKEPKADPLAGTDTDANIKTKDGKPLTYEQWKRVNDAYNRRVNEYLKKPPGSKVDTGTDLMPDADTTPPETFEKITKTINEQGGTAYKDPAAVRVENAMAKGKPVVVNEVGNYVKELQGQANTHFEQAAKTTAQANSMAKALGESHPQVQDLRAQAQIQNSQGAKYVNKITEVGARIREQAGVAAPQGQQPPSSQLAETLRNNRGADTIAQSEQIGPLSQNALNNAMKGTIEDLGRVAQAHPEAGPACQQAIADSLRDLPMSQKGQAMDLIQSKYGKDFAKGVAKAAQGPTPGARVMKGADKVMKVLGPGLIIYDGYHRITGALNAPDEAKTYVAGKAMGGFVGGVIGAAAAGAGMAAVIGAVVVGGPVTVIGAAAVLGAGLVAGALGYGVGDYAGSSLAGWMLEGVRPKDQSEYDAMAAKGLLDGSKDIYGQLIKAGVDPATAQAAADAYKRGDVKTFRDILSAVRSVLVQNVKKIPVRRFTDLATNEVQQVLDCLCSASLGANPWVAQGYNPKIPEGTGPEYSCGNLANGPCMASGFGCWRSFIRWSNPGIADCLAAFNLPTNSGFVRGQIDAAYQKPYEKPFKAVMKVEPTEVCPGDKVTVTWECEGGRGDYQFGYEIGWPLQKPEGMKTRSTWGGSWASENSSSRSVTFTVDPTLKRGFFDGHWVYTRPAEAYSTYIRGWARTYSSHNGEDYPVEKVQDAGVRLRTHAECEKLHPPPPPETKPPPKKPPVKPPTKTVTGGGGGGGGQVGGPDGVQTTSPEGTGEDDGDSTGTGAGGGRKTGGKKGSGKGGGAEPPPEGEDSGTGPKGSKGPKSHTGPSEGAEPTPPSGGVSEGGETPAPDDCYFGGGGTAINNGPMNIFVEVPPGQRLRVTIKGSDGFSQTIEGVGKVEISRPRNPNGSDTIVMENLDRPECRDQQVTQYDTNGVPAMAMPPAVTGNLAGAEAPLKELPPGADAVGSGGQLAGFVEGTGGRISADTDTEFGNNQIFGDSQIGETKSATDLKEADAVRDQAGWAAQGTKKTSAVATAAEDAQSGWGRVISDAIFGGVQEGAESAAKSFGGKAADHVASDIFDDDKEEESEGEAADGKGGGTEVAGGSSDSGSSGQGGGSKGSGKGSSKGTSKGSSKGGSTKSGHVATDSVNCPSCGKLVTYPSGQQPKWCPYCCAGPGSVECAHCGYRWCGKKGPSPAACPSCGWRKGADEPPDGIPQAPSGTPVPAPAAVSAPVSAPAPVTVPTGGGISP